MIRCKPRGLCSWDFDIQGNGHSGSLEFDWITESGRIRADGVSYRVRKGGIGSGHWTLHRGDTEVASAQKAHVFMRTIEVESDGGTITLSAAQALGRSFHFGDVATFAPDHAFTRRATIDLHQRDADFALVCFAFWLAVLMWRRAARDSS